MKNNNKKGKKKMTIQEKITELENIDGWYFINFTGIGSFKGYEITLKDLCLEIGLHDSIETLSPIFFVLPAS